MDKSAYNGNGASISNGDSLPLFLRMDSLFRELVWNTRYCFWTVQA